MFLAISRLLHLQLHAQALHPETTEGIRSYQIILESLIGIESTLFQGKVVFQHIAYQVALVRDEGYFLQAQFVARHVFPLKTDFPVVQKFETAASIHQAGVRLQVFVHPHRAEVLLEIQREGRGLYARIIKIRTDAHHLVYPTHEGHDFQQRALATARRAYQKNVRRDVGQLHLLQRAEMFNEDGLFHALSSL